VLLRLEVLPLRREWFNRVLLARGVAEWVVVFRGVEC